MAGGVLPDGPGSDAQGYQRPRRTTKSSSTARAAASLGRCSRSASSSPRCASSTSRCGPPRVPLAAARGAHRHRDLGQAREPHPDRRVQGARRAELRRARCRRAPAGRRPPGLVSATRGNHGQSLAFAGRAHAGCRSRSWCPRATAPTRTPRCEAFGAELVVHGADFQEARRARARSSPRSAGCSPVPSFHPWLVEGVATYAAELHEAVPDLDVVYVPVGMGSGHLRQHRGPRPARPATPRSSAWWRSGAGVRPVVRGGRGGDHRDGRHVRRRRRVPHAPTRTPSRIIAGGAARDRAGRRGRRPRRRWR